MISPPAWQMRYDNRISLHSVLFASREVNELLDAFPRPSIAGNSSNGGSAWVVQPEWMKLSAVAPLKAGGVIIRDLRAWVSVANLLRVISSAACL